VNFIVNYKIKFNNVINKNTFKHRLENDNYSFINNLKKQDNLRYIYTTLDKYKRFHGKMLFPLTILINKGNYKRNLYYQNTKSYRSKDILNRSQYVNYCLELENYITFTNWLEDESKEKLYEDMKQNLTNDKHTVLKIQGNYLLGNKQKNYSTILPYKAEYKINIDENILYNWKYIPYFKRSAETFICYFSPSFSINITENNHKIYKNYFSAIFKYNYTQGNKINIDILNHFINKNNFYQNIDIFIQNDDILTKLINLEKGKFVIGLFSDEIKNNNSDSYLRIINLIDIKEDTSPEEILYHKVILQIYYTYLIKNNLYICNADSLKKIFEQQSEFIIDYLKLNINLNFDIFKKLYLNKYIYIINNKLYYKPSLLSNYTKSELNIIYKNYDCEKNKMIYKSTEFQKTIFNLIFIEIYTQINRKTLIDRIKKWDRKWLIT